MDTILHSVIFNFQVLLISKVTCVGTPSGTLSETRETIKERKELKKGKFNLIFPIRLYIKSSGSTALSKKTRMY